RRAVSRWGHERAPDRRPGAAVDRVADVIGEGIPIRVAARPADRLGLAPVFAAGGSLERDGPSLGPRQIGDGHLLTRGPLLAAARERDAILDVARGRAGDTLAGDAGQGRGPGAPGGVRFRAASAARLHLDLAAWRPVRHPADLAPACGNLGVMDD